MGELLYKNDQVCRTAKILRGPSSQQDFNVRGVKYVILQYGVVYSKYIGDGKRLRCIHAPMSGSFTIKEDKT